MNYIKSQEGKLPPGKFGLPIVRQNLSFLSNLETYGEKMGDVYGDIFKTHLLGNPGIIARGTDYIDHVLNNEGILFEVSSPPTFLKLLGNSISTQHGEKHKNSRRILSSVFQGNNIINISDKTKSKSTKLLDNWSNSSEFNLYDEIRAFCFDIICEFLIGKDKLSKTEVFKAYNNFESGLFSIPINIPFSKFGKALHSKNYIRNYIDSILPEITTQSNSVLYRLLNTGLSDDEIKDQLVLLLFAGYGTLASAIWSVIYYLSQNSEVREYGFKLSLDTENSKIYQEYISAIALESLRISSPIVGLFRTITQTHTFNDYLFPQDWIISLQIRETHLSKELYPNPYKFDPTRYLGRTRQKNYAFGGGIRECIGKMLALSEIKIFTEQLISRYTWEFANINEVQVRRLPTVSPKDNYKVSFYKV